MSKQESNPNSSSNKVVTSSFLNNLKQIWHPKKTIDELVGNRYSEALNWMTANNITPKKMRINPKWLTPLLDNYKLTTTWFTPTPGNMKGMKLNGTLVEVDPSVEGIEFIL